VKTLLEFMLGLPGGGGCVNHCFIVSSGFAPHPVLHRVVQVRTNNGRGSDGIACNAMRREHC
jgi:hypothetical protein